MTTTVQDYQEALRAYQAAEKVAKDMIKLIRTVSELFYPDPFASFVGYKFGINDLVAPGRRFDPRSDIDLSEWPSVDRMGEIIRAWHQALKRLQSCWNNLPPENRVGFSEPPSHIDTRYITYRY